MKNAVQPGKVLDLVAPYAVDAGELVVSGAIVGVAAHDAENGATVSTHVEGVYDLAKVPAVVFTQGEIVYVPAVGGGPVTDNSDADSNSGGTVKLGYAVKAAGAGQSTVRVRLVPVV
ncbi:MAG: hypothetical protein BroJett013_11980 [Alphaproteobacteria bacterium]|nr:MAG: hypothetical protein BroJett013_11980 [Alphaproteobacteria bacterium]